MKIKSQKGSIALFVLIALLFYMGFLLLLYANNLNKIQTITEKTDILKGIYERNIDNINDVYNTEMAKKDNIKPIIKDIPTTINVGETEIEDPYVEYGASGGTTEYKVFSRTFTTIGDIVNYVSRNDSYGKQTISITAIGNNNLITKQDIEIEFISPYIKLEYIESTGTQYIDTGIIIDNNIGYETKISIKKLNGGNANLFGGATNVGKDMCYFVIDREGNFKYRFGDTSYNTTIYTAGVDEKLEIIFNRNNDLSINVNGNEQYVTLQEFSRTPLFYLGQLVIGNNKTVYYPTDNLIYFFKIYQSEKLVRDFIPVKRKSDNVVCMYDKVSGEFFENSGTGEFIAGPEVGSTSE